MAPVVTINPPSTDATGWGPVNYVVNIVDATDVVLTEEDIVLEATSGVTAQVHVSQAKDIDYVVTLDNIRGDSTLRFTIPAG